LCGRFGCAYRLDELQALAKSAVADVRRMSNDLRPLILEDLGLPVEVQTLVEDLGGDLPAARVACRVDGNERRLPTLGELTIFRVGQEALSNIRKHARRPGFPRCSGDLRLWD
jgi:signal transduction histidine kinase